VSPHRIQRVTARHSRIIAALVTLLPHFASDTLHSQDRLMRHFGADQGLVTTPVAALVQDSVGFLWIGGEGGLFRYDGREVRRWARSVLREPIVSLAVSAGGELVAHDRRGRLHAVTKHGAQPLPGPHTGGSGYGTIAFDVSGRLWLLQGRMLAYRTRRGEWHTVPPDAMAGEVPRRVVAAADGAVFVGTDAGIWRLGRDPTPERLVELETVTDMVALPDRLVVLTGFGQVLEVTGAGVVRDLMPDRLPPRAARAVALAVRGSTVWAVFDRYLLAVRPDQRPELLGPEDGISGGGPILVDREGSLWLGTFSGLSQFPEPETRIWRDRHGLPSRHTRFVVRARDQVWVTTWQGAAVLRRDDAGWQAMTVPWPEQARPCVDRRGVIWLTAQQGLHEIAGDRLLRSHAESPGGLYGCAEDPATGGLWLATRHGLLHSAGTRVALRWLRNLPFEERDAAVSGVLLDRERRLWVTHGDAVCRAPADSVRTARPIRWRCAVVPDALEFRDLLELPDGTIWAAAHGGVFAHGERGWQRIAGSAELGSATVFRLVPSPAGGVWVLGHSSVLRVRPRPDLPAGWEVVERLSAWHGLPGPGAADLVEDDDGALWLTTSQGLVQMPAEARFAAWAPPRTVPVEARVDDEILMLDAEPSLPHDRNRLELRFAALSFREPSLVRSQVRLSPAGPWSDVESGTTFRWVDLLPGRYQAEFRSSLDGLNWSRQTARIAFSVRPPWYDTRSAHALFALLTLLGMYAVYRTRLAFLLGLERQRTRIAMDLHDELGSGLGSIAILSGVIARGGIAGNERTAAAEEIAQSAESLGGALSDIVWSLDPRVATLHELALRLAAYGQRLFAGDDVDFTVALPEEWPDMLLPMAVRRNLLLIGLEALHNAARHARARRVTLSLAGARGAWELSVSDDGVGMPPDADTDRVSGLGVRSIARRAREIGGTVHWSPTSPSGTTITVTFRLRRRLVWPHVAFRRRGPRQPAPRMIMRAHEHQSMRNVVTPRSSTTEATAPIDDPSYHD
jgi:signal transduction histidine kinase/ligand-binding sensor domain-containing protein